MLDKTKSERPANDAVVIKKYANRRLYNTETSTYVTLENLAEMVRADRDFVVFDAKSGDDLTHAVLTQIIVEQESRAGGPTLLPIPFLRQLIRFYDDSLGNMVPGYLQFSMEALTQQQDAYRKKFANAWGTSGLEVYQEQARKNLAIFEQAMSIWAPAYKASQAAERGEAPETVDKSEEPPSSSADQPPQKASGEGAAAAPAKKSAAETDKATAATVRQGNEIDSLKAELAAMQQRIEKLSQER